MSRLRRFWGWGYEGEGLSPEQIARLRERVGAYLGAELRQRTPPAAGDIDLRAPRLRAPRSLEAVVSSDTLERASHSYGKSYADVVRGLRGEFPNPPDLVARPRSERDVTEVLEWCASSGAAAIPYGGGSSVVGGVEPEVGDRYGGTVTIDLSRLDRVLDIDTESRAARIQAGVYGPSLEDQLRPHGLTLRHFPQSFELSTLGGWIATRSGGHYATLHTHIDDFVESLSVVTPTGLLETRRLPASGAGPSPDRLLIGSEGILGIITEAWMRLQERPRFRAGTAVRFGDFWDGVAAARAVAQSGLNPANCRLLDPLEALTSGTDSGSSAVLILGFESADHPMDHSLQRALELCSHHGGEPEGARGERPAPGGRPPRDAAGSWRRSFLAAPYARDALVSMGVLCETFETSVTWDGFENLHSSVTSATEAALRQVGASPCLLSCRFTHVYPDGPAPYFSVFAPAREGAELEQWGEVKRAASDAVLAAGGTITHHHAVGREHRPWYDRQRPDLFAAALSAAKLALDPASIMNPGVLLDPP